ncbi:MAG: hypothetical protein CM1200mP41_38940 [Gammaproteobacteria bacterium]|nr:MAG: hypothetical protein CM1200mP41_38940 [Gammaproteobacteria bacterium]
MGLPVGSAPTPYPPYAQPLLDMMIGLTPIEIVWTIVAMSLAGILLIGAFGPVPRPIEPMDRSQKGLIQRQKAKTRPMSLTVESVVYWACSSIDTSYVPLMESTMIFARYFTID